MPDVMSISGNTIVPALCVIESLGYRVSISVETGLVSAHGDLGTFVAEDPVQLLGLIQIRKCRGPHWQPSDFEVEQFAFLLDPN